MYRSVLEPFRCAVSTLRRHQVTAQDILGKSSRAGEQTQGPGN